MYSKRICLLVFDICLAQDLSKASIFWRHQSIAMNKKRCFYGLSSDVNILLIILLLFFIHYVLIFLLFLPFLSVFNDFEIYLFLSFVWLLFNYKLDSKGESFRTFNDFSNNNYTTFGNECRKFNFLFKLIPFSLKFNYREKRLSSRAHCFVIIIVFDQRLHKNLLISLVTYD